MGLSCKVYMTYPVYCMGQVRWPTNPRRPVTTLSHHMLCAIALPQLFMYDLYQAKLATEDFKLFSLVRLAPGGRVAPHAF